jgi:hypothetical protein
MIAKTPVATNIIIVKTGATSPDTVSAGLYILNRGIGLSFARLATLDHFSGIPPGTLSTIAKTKQVPKVWQARLGARPRQRPRFTGNRVNMQSLADTIWSQVDDPEKVLQLTQLLRAKLQKHSGITIRINHNEKCNRI